MGLTKDLKEKLSQAGEGAGPAPTQDERYQLGKGALIVFLLGLVFWSAGANICVSGLMREWPNETGNPRALPILSMCVSGLAVLTSLLGGLWLWKHKSLVLYFGFLVFALLSSLYIVSSIIILGYTFVGKLQDCPHEQTFYRQHVKYQVQSFTCEGFNAGMIALAAASATFDVIGLISLLLLFIITLLYQLPYILDRVDEYASNGSGYVLVTTDEEAPQPSNPTQ
jgi:hypothetical protein